MNTENFNKVTNTIIRLLSATSASLFVAFLSIWNGIEFHEYVWDWSDNDGVLALQYLANVLWGTLFCVSPAIWLVLTMLFFGFNFKKDENENSLEDDLRSF